jgi:hypothetical protein
MQLAAVGSHFESMIDPRPVCLPDSTDTDHVADMVTLSGYLPLSSQRRLID